jgi:hypothetical protein
MVSKKLNRMKAIVIYIFLLVFIVQFAGAQEHGNKFELAITGGLSFPAGRFANKNYVPGFDKPNGLAKNGYGINAQLYYRHREKYGFSLLLGYSSNEQDLSDFGKVARPIYYSNINRVETFEKSWKIIKAMPGIYFEAPLSPGSKFIIRPVFSAGFCKTNKPENKAHYYTTDEVLIAASQSDKISLPLTICFQGDISLIYTINKKIYALLDADYFFANPVHKFSYRNGSGNMVKVKTKYNLSSINTLIGIGITM